MRASDVVPAFSQIARGAAVAFAAIIGRVADPAAVGIALDDVVSPGAGAVEAQDRRRTLGLLRGEPDPRFHCSAVVAEVRRELDDLVAAELLRLAKLAVDCLWVGGGFRGLGVPPKQYERVREELDHVLFRLVASPTQSKFLGGLAVADENARPLDRLILSQHRKQGPRYLVHVVLQFGSSERCGGSWIGGEDDGGGGLPLAGEGERPRTGNTDE